MIHSPFKFLDSYTKEDSSIFFGREKETEELYRKVFDSKIILLYGVYGTGKSSLIHCGLANKFEESDWLPINIRRGKNINDSLEKEVSKLAITKIKEGKSLKKQLQSIYLDHFKPIYLIFDQFEELFIFGDQNEREKFINSVQIIMESGIQVKFIFVIREEYLANITEFENKIPTFLENRMRIEKMRISKAYQCVEGPCKVFDINVEDGFSETLLKRLNPGSQYVELTYLQVYLDKVYRLSDGKNLKLELLEQLGDVKDLLGIFLDEQISLLKDPDYALAILKSFVSIKGTKKQVSEEEVASYCLSIGQSVGQELVKELIAHFVNIRILRDKDESGRYELRHDALAAKIFEKITMVEKELMEVKQFVETAHQNYVKRGILLSEKGLGYVAPYLNKMFLNDTLNNFVNICKLDLHRKNQRKRQVKFIIAGILIFLTSLLSIWALIERNNAEHQKDQAKANMLAANSFNMLDKNTTISLQLAREALKKDTNSLLAYKSLLNSYYGGWVSKKLFYNPSYDYNLIHISPSNKYIVFVPFRSDNVQIWDTLGNKVSDFESGNGSIIQVKFSDDEKGLLISGYRGGLKLFDINGGLIHDFTNCESFNDFAGYLFGQNGFVTGSVWDNIIKIYNNSYKLERTIKLKDRLRNLSVSPKGNCIAYSIRNELYVDFINNSSNKRSIKRSHSNKISSISFNNNGNLIVVADEDSAKIWRLDGIMLKSFKHDLKGENLTRFNSKSDQIFMANVNGGSIYIYDTTGSLKLKLPNDQESIDDIVFNTSNSTFYTVSKTSKDIRKWVNILENINIQNAHRDLITCISISPKDNKFATSSHDSTIVIWDFYGNKLQVLKGHNSIVNSVKYSHNGSMLVTAGNDNSAIIWDKNGELIKRIDFNYFPIEDASFSFDDSLIAIISPLNIARVVDLSGNIIDEYKWTYEYSWNLGDASWWPRFQHFDSLGSQIKYKEWVDCFVNSAELSRNGELLITANDNNTATVWTTDGELLLSLNGHDDRVIDASFSKDDEKIVTACVDGAIKIWDKNGKLLNTIDDVNDVPRFAVFSYDNKSIVVQTFQDSIYQFSLDGELIDKHRWFRYYWSSVSLSPNNKYLLTSTRDGYCRLWNRKTKSFKKLGEAYMSSFSLDGSYILTADNDNPTLTLWDTLANKFTVFEKHGENANSIMFSDDNQFVLSTTIEDKAKLWDLNGDELFSIGGKNDQKVYAAISHSNRFIVSANTKNELQISPIDKKEILNEINKHAADFDKLSISDKKAFKIELNDIDNTQILVNDILLQASVLKDYSSKIEKLLNAANILNELLESNSGSFSFVEKLLMREKISNVYKEVAEMYFLNNHIPEALETCAKGFAVFTYNKKLICLQAIIDAYNGNLEEAYSSIDELWGKPVVSGNESFNKYVINELNRYEELGVQCENFSKVRRYILRDRKD